MKNVRSRFKWKLLLGGVIAILSCVVLSSCKQENSPQENLKWWQDTLVYEIYPSSFQDTEAEGIGNLKGITSRLDHLADLGVGAIWLTPVFASPMGDNGYDVSNYFDINPRYGTMEDMDELIEKAKKKNIKIVMDLVFNHTSNENSWFKESEKSKNNDKSDWYIWRDAAPDGGAPNNWRSIFGGSAWTWDAQRQQYYLHTFADFQPDVNWENPKVRQALYDVANFWLDKGVGGFRLDAVTYIKKPSELSNGPSDGPDNLSGIHNMTANTPGILDFLHEFKEKVQDGHDIFTVGEANGVPNEQLDQWVGKNGVFDMIFSFDLVNVQFVKDEVWSKTKDFSPADIKKILVDLQKSSSNDRWCPIFFENHDQPRSVDHFFPGCSDYVNCAKVLATILNTLRGTPFIYEGEELGMTNVNKTSIDQYNDLSSHNQYKQALANGLNPEQALKCVQWLSRDNARSPMQWDTTQNAGFTKGTPWLAVNSNYPTINAEVEKADDKSVLSWYYKLKDLRRDNKVLVNGDFEEVDINNDNVFCYTRINNDSKATIIVNLSGEEANIKQNLNLDKASLVLNNYDDVNKERLLPYQAICYIEKK